MSKNGKTITRQEKKGMKKKEKEKASNSSNPLADTIESLRAENAQLKQALFGLQRQVQLLISRVDKNELFMHEMDVALRNHSHRNKNVEETAE